jgi:hypothetical protein
MPTPFTMPQQNKNNFKPTLIHLMSLVDSVTYEKDQEFTQEQLTALTPGSIERWMKLRAYGTPDPGPDANPTHCCSTSLEYWKKALSNYMPNRLMHWHVTSQQGNPTKSIEVNDLIKKTKKIKKVEVRKKGRKSSA